ncbi:hypothetical protein T265_11960 [Opisthorchis viverrini]|uniref:Uncharacterized protein n=1 Tax=Opisthorchis viverrini TaxID=6198 RepID=A0A074ZVL1_OPIVI|nr:hypothetical protein T265_11960 [Opisthorchis viverrini]KER19179.1 hypothetical protein T265_11960 [Opisthorchis viverrini]
MFEQGLVNIPFIVDAANTRLGHGERQPLNGKNKADQGNLGETFDPVSVNISGTMLFAARPLRMERNFSCLNFEFSCKHQESQFYIPDVVLSETNTLGVSNGFSHEAPAYETLKKPTNLARRNNEYQPPASERPIFVSTPHYEPSSCSVTEAATVIPSPISRDPKHDTDYFLRKAKRISRLYTDSNSFDQFDGIDVDTSLLDYLVRHGAISEETSQQILLARPTDRKGMLLVSLGVPLIGDHLTCGALHPSNPVSTTGFALLINALRHTGHHSLASQLDIGRRITPSPGLVACEIESHGKLLFQLPPLDSPLTVLDLCTNLSAPACSAQLPPPPPKSSVNKTAAAKTTVRRVRGFLTNHLNIILGMAQEQGQF